jgi:protein-tyrosine phosphatase
MKMAHSDAFSIVIVCTGNLVRSPFAAALLQARCDEELPGRFTVTSAGTEAREGMALDVRTRASLALRGIDASGARSARLRPRTLLGADLVLGASRDHVEFAMTMAPSILHRTFTLTGLAAILDRAPMPIIHDAGNPLGASRAIVRQAAFHRSLAVDSEDIADPLGQQDAAHEAMVRRVSTAVTSIVDGLVVR